MGKRGAPPLRMTPLFISRFVPVPGPGIGPGAPEVEDSGIPAPHSTLTSIYVGYSQPVDLSPSEQKACGTCPGPVGGGSLLRQVVVPKSAGDDSKSEDLGSVLETSLSDGIHGGGTSGAIS